MGRCGHPLQGPPFAVRSKGDKARQGHSSDSPCLLAHCVAPSNLMSFFSDPACTALSTPHPPPGAGPADPADGDGDRWTPGEQTAFQEIVRRGGRHPKPDMLHPPRAASLSRLQPSPDPSTQRSEQGWPRPPTSPGFQ